MGDDMKELVRKLRRIPGVSLRQNGTHLRVTGPDGRKVSIPSTPSDRRSYKNTIAQLRRIGVAV